MPYFAYRGYKDDGGTYWAQRISSEIALAVDNSMAPSSAFGWSATIVPSTPFRPTEITMRAIDLVSTDGTLRRRVNVGDPAASSLWQDPSLTVDLQDALGNTVTYVVVGTAGEEHRYPRNFSF